MPRAKTPKAGSGRWQGPIWDAIDAEAARRNTAARVSTPDDAAAASASGWRRRLDRSAGRDWQDDADAWGAENGEEDVASWVAPQDSTPLW